MWTRGLIKERAKGVLKFNYWKAFVVSLVIVIAGGNSNGGGDISITREYSNFENTFIGHVEMMFGSFTLFLVSIVFFLIILRVFIGYMLEVGGRKFFIRAAEGESYMGYLGYCFHEGRYFSVFITMLLRSIYVFLWTLLLIIPGIVKSYAYRMVPYILADNPSIGYNRAIELSNEMTKGEKWNIFVLDLSFIGWYLLGALAFLVGVLFVQPYDDATNAELYLILRQDAIARGLTSYEELNMTE
ncbi:DUF975 family protein [Brassicibacter mesophilus]|uniref:DUF975 family protein n=1 Tax=Brassicibacter mesophilus TaxID=745119 RepID=UPI003D1EB347